MPSVKGMTTEELDKEAIRGEKIRQEGRAIKRAVQEERDSQARQARIKAMTDKEQTNLYEELGQVLGAKGIPSEEAVGTPGAE